MHPSLFSELLPSQNTSLKKQHKIHVESLQAETRPRFKGKCGITTMKMKSRHLKGKTKVCADVNRSCGLSAIVPSCSVTSLSVLRVTRQGCQALSVHAKTCLTGCIMVKEETSDPETHPAPPHHSYKLQSVPCSSLCCCAQGLWSGF